MNGNVLVAGISEPRRDRAALPGILRASVRAFCIVFFSGIALLEIAIQLPFLDPAQRNASRAAWLHRWSRFACRILGLRLTTRGPIPRRGLLVCNHLSYLDIIALSALRPSVFVAKQEVGAWPLFGWLARAAGTIFVQRQQRTSTARVVQQIGRALAENHLVVLFPEGTSSDGRSVLPFKSALLAPALALAQPIGSAAIRYGLRDGSVADEVCYWRDMTLVPHLANLFSKREIEADLFFAPPISRSGERKGIARELRAEVERLLLR